MEFVRGFARNDTQRPIRHTGSVSDMTVVVGLCARIEFWGFSTLEREKYYRGESPSIVESPPFLVSWNPRWGIGILRGGS